MTASCESNHLAYLHPNSEIDIYLKRIERGEAESKALAAYLASPEGKAEHARIEAELARQQAQQDKLTRQAAAQARQDALKSQVEAQALKAKVESEEKRRRMAQKYGY